MSKSLSSYQAEPRGVAIPVYYEGTDTIYEGMAVCYNSDTTTNKSRYNSQTTAEGSQNEGKHWFVEKPSNDNLAFFAGVVRKGGYCGKAGPAVIDIYIPDGSIVPVRSSIQSYEGETVLAVQSGDYEFQAPNYDTRSLACAVAMEDVNRGTTEGLCLAALYHPNTFNWQSVGFTGTTAGSSQRWEVGNGVTTGAIIPMRTFFNNRQTGGSFNANRIRVESLGGGENYNLGGCLRAELDINAAATTGQVIGAYLMFSDGATTAFTEGQVMELKAEDGTGAVVTGADIAVLKLATYFNVSAPSTLCMLRCRADGTNTPDYFMVADSEAAVAYTACTDTPTQSLKCLIGGNVRYIMVSEAAS